MTLSEIHIRDPYVLPFEGKYYLYGSRGGTCWGPADGFDCFVSGDLRHWDGPCEIFRRPENFWSDRHFWAPEVHFYQGAFYLFASFKAEGVRRGTQILKASNPLGPFGLHSDGPVTPSGWDCLDGTLYVEGGAPYIVFCHEWTQIKNGTVCALKLSADLREPIGEPFLMFRGADPGWAIPNAERYVTDGPFLYKTSNGELLMLWSTFASDYVQAVARSADGSLKGPWTHDEDLLFIKDGGHGMLFRTFGGELMLTLHQPNTTPDERPKFFSVTESRGRLSVYC